MRASESKTEPVPSPALSPTGERFIPGDLFGGIVYGPGSSLSRALAAPFLRYNCRFRASARATVAVLFRGVSSVPSSGRIRNPRGRILRSSIGALFLPALYHRRPLFLRRARHLPLFYRLLLNPTHTRGDRVPACTVVRFAAVSPSLRPPLEARSEKVHAPRSLIDRPLHPLPTFARLLPSSSPPSGKKGSRFDSIARKLRSSVRAEADTIIFGNARARARRISDRTST